MKSKASIILLTILIFLLGGIAGAVSHSLYQEYLKAAFFKANARPLDIVDGFAKEFNLDQRQVESLKIIFDESRKRNEELSRKVGPQYEKVWRETEQQIKNMLRDDQRARYEEFLRKFQPPMPDSPGSPPK
jgi:uncharacterized membrane protein